MTSTHSSAPDDIFTDKHRWGDLDDWNETALRLHERGGIHRIERDGIRPFWAVIDHAAVLDIERQPQLFTNRPEPVLATNAQIEGRQAEIRSLIHMDDPEHADYRRLVADWFKPKTIGELQPRLDELSRKAVAKLEEAGGQCDFAAEIALPYPLEVILSILGLPETDYQRMLTLTQHLFGQEDPDLQRGEASPELQAEVIADFSNYFTELIASRRATPTGDLASAIANGTIDGEPLPPLQTMGLYIIVATAGHDTTSSAMAGGLQALIDHPEQLDKLLADPDTLLNNAIEEMLRWTASVRHFMRTATADTEVLGQQIKEGDWLYLSYKAANLDPKVFDDPLRFDIERPNAAKQISFGYGVHFCLGAQLARLELRSLFSHLLARLEHVEFAGEPAASKTTFVGGYKTLPISYTLR